MHYIVQFAKIAAEQTNIIAVSHGESCRSTQIPAIKHINLPIDVLNE